MKINSKIIPFAVALLVLTATVGCGTSKPAAGKAHTIEKPVLDTSRVYSPEEMVTLLQENQPAFRRAYANKMSLFIDFKGRKMDVKASCKIVSDSALHLSIQPFFGIELFKLELTPNAMIVIDKANRRFYESNYGVFKSQLGIVINYDAVQSLISNRLFVAGKKAFLPDDFSWKTGEMPRTLAVQAETMRQETVIDLALARIAETVLQTNDSAYSMTTTYTDFSTFNGTLFPQKILINGAQGETRASFHFTIEEAKFDVPFPMEATNLSKYTRGDVNAFFTQQ